MSNEILNQCWKLPIPQATKFVLISLADQANDVGVCWPSVSFICERTCLSERTVQGATKFLAKTGAIQLKSNAGPNGCHLYTVTPDQFTPAGDTPPQDLHPAANAPHPAGAAPPPPQEVRQSPQELRPNPKEPSTNHQEPKKKRTQVGLGIEDLVAEGVGEQVAKDWFAVRKSKRSMILTATGWRDLKAEMTKTGLTIDEAVRIAVTRNWAGFKASWNWRGESEHRDQRNNGSPPKPSIHTGFDTYDYEEDAEEWNRK